MKTRIIIIAILVLAIASIPIISHLDNIGYFGGLPGSLRQCPELPEGANYVIAYSTNFPWDSRYGLTYHSKSYVEMVAVFDYDLTTVGLQEIGSNVTVPFQDSIWVGGPEGYWVWGTASNENHSRWHPVTGMQLLGHPVVIYDEFCTPIWDIYS